jgi:hypothetical protein
MYSLRIDLEAELTIAVAQITCLYDMDIVPDPPGTWNFNEVYLYEELMEADLHAIVRSCRGIFLERILIPS